MKLNNYKADTCIPLKKAWKRGELELASLVRLNYPGNPMPAHMLKEVNSIGYWDTRTQQNWGLDWHRNEGIEITYLETGSLSLSVERQQNTTMRANQFTIMRPWQLHKLGNPNIGIGRLYWIILDVKVRNPHQSWEWPKWIVLSKKDLKDLTTMLRQNEKVVWQSDAKINSYFHEIGQLIHHENIQIRESELIILINNILLNILHILRKGDIELDKSLMESKRSVELFLEELPSHIDKTWTLESMAKNCNLGTTRFVHFCKKITNMTPMQYLNYLRLNRASEMLQVDDAVSIKEIAYDCGYTSSQYFATQFKKQFGINPKTYKKQVSEMV